MSAGTTPLDVELSRSMITSTGESLFDLQERIPILLVFLRHAGCTFCRQTLQQLDRQREAIQSHGVQPVFVHMMPPAEAPPFFAEFGWQNAPQISDPEQRLYRSFALPRGSLNQVAGPALWWSGLKSVLGAGLGVPQGDVFQLSGAFVIHRGQIWRSFRAQNSAEHPDYADLASCPIPPRAG